MKRAKILQILMIIIILIFVSLTVYDFSDPPIECHDGTEMDPDTGD
ncbi:MAG: hypothetical protein ISS01_01760 [Nanoarchaeota archaeon]|nr:hypothetical protein [Nanoarchaeota archaeon]